MRQLFYGISVFLSSACGLIVEIVAGRLLAPYVGMSLYTWTAIIAVVLAGLSAGHWIGGQLAKPHVDARIGARRVAAALGGAAISTLAVLVLLRVLADSLLGQGLAPIPVIIILTMGVFFIPSLFVGIVSPILTKIAVDDTDKGHGHVIGSMYTLGTLGSIAGTLAAGYLLISWIGSSGTIILVAALYAILALAFAVADPLRLLLVAALVGGGSGLYAWGDKMQAFASPCTVESDYFCIRIDTMGELNGEARLMALDHLVHSINVINDPGLLPSPYIHFVDEMTKLRLGPDLGPHAFFIGGGGYTLPRTWLYDYDDTEIIVAEIDPAVTRAAYDHMGLIEFSQGLQVLHEDGRIALQKLPAEPTFDVIFGDAFHDISIPPHLVTQEFHHEIAKRLNPKGFYAINVVDQGFEPRLLLSLVKTLRIDFSTVEVWVDREQYGTPGRITFVVVASQQPTGEKQLQAVRGLDRNWQAMSTAQMTAYIDTHPLPTLTDDYAPVDRLMSSLLNEAE